MPTRIVPFWGRLSVRLTAVIIVITTGTIGAFALAAARAHERQLLDQVERGAALFSETIKSSTYHDMLTDRRDDAYLIMDTIGRQEGIEKVRIFNKEGRITFSTDRHEVGTLVDKKAESCYACHAANQPLQRLTITSRRRTYQRGDHQVLGMVTPIYNEPSCSNAACHVHPASQSVLGVVDIGMSLAEVDAAMAGLRRNTIGLTVLAVLALATLVWYFERRFVVQPVNEVVSGTQRIATGDLSTHLRVRRRDEIGLLAESFNKMADSLDEAQDKLGHVMENLEHLVDARTDELRRAQAQLVQSEKLSSLGRLAASVAHEINNPLSGILTYAKLLIRMLESRELDEKTRVNCVRQLKLVERETERCTAIVRSLLEFARQRPLAIQDVSVQAIMDEALQLLAHQTGLQNVTIEKRYGPALPVQRRRGPAPAGVPEHRVERLRRDAERRRAVGLDLAVERRGDGARRHGRHRQRHPGGVAAEDPRPVLHHQGDGHGARPVGRVRDCRAARRQARHPESVRPRDDGADPAGRSEGAGWCGDRHDEEGPRHAGHLLLVAGPRALARRPARGGAAARRARLRARRRGLGRRPSGRRARSTRAAASTRRPGSSSGCSSAGRPRRASCWASRTWILFIPILTFVFGEAQLAGRASIVSTARLAPDGRRPRRRPPARGAAGEGGRARGGAQLRPRALRRPPLRHVALGQPHRRRREGRRTLPRLLDAIPGSQGSAWGPR